jgi:hypothetical protein
MILRRFNKVRTITDNCINLQVSLAFFSIILMLLITLVHKFVMNSCNNSEAFNDVGSVTCISTIIDLLDINHPVFLLKQLFGDWILSPSSGKSSLCWAQSTELTSISGHQNQLQTEYVKTIINNCTSMRPSTCGHASFDGQSA